MEPRAVRKQDSCTVPAAAWNMNFGRNTWSSRALRVTLCPEAQGEGQEVVRLLPCALCLSRCLSPLWVTEPPFLLSAPTTQRNSRFSCWPGNTRNTGNILEPQRKCSCFGSPWVWTDPSVRTWSVSAWKRCCSRGRVLSWRPGTAHSEQVNENQGHSWLGLTLGPTMEA